MFSWQARADGEKRGRETAVEGLENEVKKSPTDPETDSKTESSLLVLDFRDF